MRTPDGRSLKHLHTNENAGRPVSLGIGREAGVQIGEASAVG